MDQRPENVRPRTALVLAGGGALGAYEAGVLSYVLADLRKDLGAAVCFDISLRGATGKLAAGFLKSSAFAETDLLSVLMFTPTFIRSLLELGRHDAEANRDTLMAFFSNSPSH